MRGWMRAAFTLYWCSKRSFWKQTFHLTNDAGYSWKINSFLSFQIFHKAQAKISMKHGPSKFFLTYLILLEICTLVSQYIPMDSQHLRANSHSKKRCSLVSRVAALQRTQFDPESKCQFFLVIRSRVFSRSRISNHENTLSFGSIRDFQIADKVSSPGIWANMKLENLDGAYAELPHEKILWSVLLASIGFCSSNSETSCNSWNASFESGRMKWEKISSHSGKQLQRCLHW
jgi:hypothetical protein